MLGTHSRYAASFVIALLAVSCGSTIEEGTGASTGGGGSVGGAGGATSNGGSGTGGATATSSSLSAGGGTSECAGLFEFPCLAAFPGCVPIYDDTCCPTCDVAPCADCQHFMFHHCAPFADACGATLPCGTLAVGACKGAPSNCPSITAGGEYACTATPGCVVATCSPDVNCMEAQCHAVTSVSCQVLCATGPPSCPVGFTPEGDGECWTGFCIPGQVCGVQ